MAAWAEGHAAWAAAPGTGAGSIKTARERNQRRGLQPVADAWHGALQPDSAPSGRPPLFLAEDAPGKRAADEPADSVEVGEVAEQVGERGHVGPDRAVDPPGPGILELLVARGDEADPVVRRPRPKRRAVLQAAPQDEADGVGHGPAVGGSVGAPPKRGSCVVERAEQTGDRPPLDPVRGIATASADFPAQTGQCCTLAFGELGPTVVSGQVNGPRPGRGRGRLGSGRRYRRGHSATVPVAGSPRRASICTRQPWICSMPRLSLSARSRPDRWM